VPLPTNVYSIIVIDVGSLVNRYYEARDLERNCSLKYLRSLGKLRTKKVESLPNMTFSSAGALSFIDDGIRIAGGEDIFRDISKDFSLQEIRILLVEILK